MISMSARIGLQALAILVDSWERDERMHNKDIAEKVGCSQKTLTPRLISLVKADILSSATGGTDRGYRLMRDPKNISLGDIMKVLNGKIVFHCCKDVMDINCPREKEDCLVWQTVNGAILSFKRSCERISLYDYARGKQGE